MYTLIYQIFLTMYQIDDYQCKIFTLFVMATSSLVTKFSVIDSKLRRSKCMEYTIFKIHASTNLLCNAFLIFHTILYAIDSEDQNTILIFPLLFFLILAEFFSEFVDHMKPLPETFFNNIERAELFLESVQYFLDDFSLTRDT